MAEDTKKNGPEVELTDEAQKQEQSTPAKEAPPALENAAPGSDSPVLKVTGKNIEIPIPTSSEDTMDKGASPTPTPEDPEQDPKKPKRGRPAEVNAEKAAPEEKTKRKGHSAKSNKAAADKNAKPQKDKVSRGKTGKESLAQTAVGTGGGTAPPAVESAEPMPPPRPVEEQKIVYLKISELHEFHTFREHPFKVVDDSPQMQELISSIKKQGVFTPATVRPEKDGNGYEIIAGHCRRRGSELAGLDVLPCIIRDMTDHEAVQEMKNSNKQRGEPFPSELARLLDLEMEDIKHQGTKLKGVAEGDIGKRSAEIVGEMHNMNYKKVMRYIRLNSLVPELLDKVDAKTMGFMPAVELSYIKPKNQRLIAVSIDGEQASPSVSQAKRLRELDKDGKLTGDVIDGILSEEKKEVDKVIITTDELNMYFGKEYTPRQMKDQIISLLDEWKAKQPQEKNTPEQTAERG